MGAQLAHFLQPFGPLLELRLRQSANLSTERAATIPYLHNPGQFGQTESHVSIPVENSSLFRSKIPQPSLSGGLQFRLVSGKQNPAGEAEAGNAGVQPAKE